MDAKLRQVSRLLKRYDSDLQAKRSLDGRLDIFRKRRDYEIFRWDTHTLFYAHDWEDLILPVTHNWTESGTPVDWGIEPILWQIQKTDGWRDDQDYARFCESRAQRKANRERAHRNELRAAAADMRRDFAKATNDINTSSLAKLDRRRKWQ